MILVVGFFLIDISTLLLIDADAECYTDSALDVNFSSVCLEILFLILELANNNNVVRLIQHICDVGFLRMILCITATLSASNVTFMSL